MFGRILLLATLLLATGDASAHVRTMSETGLPLYWSNPSALSFNGNPTNSSGLTGPQVQAAFGGAFNTWNVSGSRVSLAYNQSTGYPANSNYDGSNSVYFASAGGRYLDWGVVAVTEVLYYVNSGQIAEADMVFNDRQFNFTDTEGDTGKYIGGKTAIYLPDVATHEAGHAIGLDHNAVNLSSMIYTAFSGQFTPNQDDRTSVLGMYPASVPAGSLSGSVRGSNGGIFGAQVSAVNLATGQVQAAVLSNPDGSFRLGELPDGAYSVFMEPLATDISTISSYFREVDHRFCGSSRYHRRFYGPCGTASAAVVEVSGGSAVALGSLAPSCSAMGNPGGAPSTLPSARDIPGGKGAMFGTLTPGQTHYYKLSGVSGAINARALSYSLYSAINVKVDILTSAGGALAGATSIDDVQNPMPGGYINYDSSAAANVSTGDYIVRVSAVGSWLSFGKYPAGFDLQDSDGYYLLSVSVDGDYGVTGPSDMAACANLSNYSQHASYRSPSSYEQKEVGGGCGTLGGSGGAGPGSGGGPGALSLVFLAALLAHGGLRLGRLPALKLVRRRR